MFTGWNLTARLANPADPRRFVFNPNAHDTAEKTFTFEIYPGGGRTIPPRLAADGMQDGLDLISALASSPDTAHFLARKLYRFFVSEFGDVPAAFISRIANVYLASGLEMKPVVRSVLVSPEFWDERSYYARYAWPVELVVRAIKDIGWRGFSVDIARAELASMGQNLFEPPDVNGWDLGPAWFSTGSMLARMNFAAVLAANQKFNLATAAQPYGRTPDTLLAYVLDSVGTAPLDPAVVAELSTYVHANGPWTGSTVQLQAKASGLVHLVAATAEYQFV